MTEVCDFNFSARDCAYHINTEVEAGSAISSKCMQKRRYFTH